MNIDMKKIWEEVKANHALLDSCKLHDFEKMDNQVENGRWRNYYVCKCCGGTIDFIAYTWYMKGVEHGGASIAKEVVTDIDRHYEHFDQIVISDSVADRLRKMTLATHECRFHGVDCVEDNCSHRINGYNCVGFKSKEEQ